MRRLILSDWAAISEVAGTVAIVISLIFVAHSINLNTKFMQASNDNFIYGLQDAHLALVTDNADFASIFVKVQSNEELSAIELLRWQINLSRMLNLWELSFSRHQEGLMATQPWQTWNKSFAGTFLDLVPKERWEDIKGDFNDDFEAHVDAILLSN